MKKSVSDRRLNRFDLGLLLGIMAIAAVVRLAYLDSKPPWTDEFATLVFSLGHSFRTVPLDQVISTDVLLQPLRPEPGTTAQGAIANLMAESTHPPVYFWLSHHWLSLFPPLPSGLVSLWAGRSLSVVFAVLTIPAVFGLGWLAFGSPLVGYLAAALMAVSPYAVFLAQDARHYTLAILLVTLSLLGLMGVARAWRDRRPIPLGLCLGWAAINALGVAVHYFFMLTLVSEAIALGALVWGDRPWPKAPLLRMNLGRLAGVAIAAAAGCLVWLPELWQNQNNSLTDWIFFDRGNLLMWLNPLFQSLAAWVVMLCLLPLEADFIPFAGVAGVVMLAFLVWSVPLLWRGLVTRWQDRQTRWAVLLLGSFSGGAIALIFTITYGLGRDLTRGARYNFVYFPAVMVLLGAALAVLWQLPQVPQLRPHWLGRQFPRQGQQAVGVVLLIGLLSALSVATNLGYEKYYRPEQLAAQMRQHVQAPMLVATTHQTHVHTGEMMGIAREFKLAPDASPYTLPRFLLAHYEGDRLSQASDRLQQVLQTYPRPFDLWLVNWRASKTLNAPACQPDPIRKIWINGYSYDLFRCR